MVKSKNKLKTKNFPKNIRPNVLNQDVQTNENKLINENKTEYVSKNISQEIPEQSAQSASGGGIKDETRKIIAKYYICAFLIIVGLTLSFMLIKGCPVADIKDILLAESGILSGPLGFIIGFYFKEESLKEGKV